MGTGNRRILNVGTLNGGGLDMCRLNSGILDLQRADRAGLQLARTHRIDGELCAGNAARCKLSGRNRAAFQGIRDGAEGYGSILPRQAVVGILRHAHGYFHADAPRNNTDAVAQEDIRERGILLVFFGVGQIDEINLKRNTGKIAASIELRLRCFAHICIALALALFIVAVLDLAGFGYLQVNPFRVDVCADIRRVDIELRQI